jgi:hypothetical protein
VGRRPNQTAAVILLLPIFEADMHEHSYAYRPRRNAHQAMDQIKSAILKGHTEILDADLSALPAFLLKKLRWLFAGRILGRVSPAISAALRFAALGSLTPSRMGG